MSDADFHDDLKQKSKYRFWFKDHVRFNDLDALGHVGSVRSGEYFAGARTSLFQQAITDWPKSTQLAVLKLSITQHENEIWFPSDLDIGLWVERFGNSSVRLVAALFDQGKCLALNRSVFVFIDMKTRAPVVPHAHITQNFIKLAG